MSNKSPKAAKAASAPAPKVAPTRLVSTQLGLTFSIGREARLFRQQCPSLRVGPRPIVWNVTVLETIVMDLMRNLVEKVRAEGDNRLQPEHIRHFVEQSPLLRRMLGQDSQFMWSAMTNYIHPEVMHSKTRKNTKKDGETDPLQAMSKKDLIKQVKAQQRALTKAKTKKTSRPASAPAAAAAASAAPVATKKVKKAAKSATSTPVASVKKTKAKKTAAATPAATATPTASVKKTTAKKTAAAVPAPVASVKKSKKTVAAQ